jgi:membrane-bound serine protease (ClpP class)
LRVKIENPKRDVTLNLSSPVLVRVPMSAKQQFLHFVADPNVSTMLLTLGGLALWAEISSGFSSIAAGVIGIFCFVLGMVSLQTLPVNIGGAVLLGLGFVLLVLEAFVTSYGLLSVGALVSLFLGGLFLIDPGSGSMRVSLSLLIAMVAGVGAILVGVGYVLARDRAGLRENPLIGAEARVSSSEGLQGTAYVNGELWNFISDTPVSAGESLWVRSVQGLKIYLERKQ